jgi:hypothetical protein
MSRDRPGPTAANIGHDALLGGVIRMLLMAFLRGVVICAMNQEAADRGDVVAVQRALEGSHADIF